MKEDTKACNLTKEEITILIKRHGFDMSTETAQTQSAHIERINYLNKRLEAFKDELPEAIASTANAAGWSSDG